MSLASEIWNWQEGDRVYSRFTTNVGRERLVGVELVSLAVEHARLGGEKLATLHCRIKIAHQRQFRVGCSEEVPIKRTYILQLYSVQTRNLLFQGDHCARIPSEIFVVMLA